MQQRSAAARAFACSLQHRQCEVEAHDALDLPIGRTPAWRVHIQWPSSGEDFRVVAWYGRAGYLGLQVHSVSELVDATGNVIGTFVYDEDERCDEIALVE